MEYRDSLPRRMKNIQHVDRRLLLMKLFIYHVYGDVQLQENHWSPFRGAGFTAATPNRSTAKCLVETCV